MLMTSHNSLWADERWTTNFFIAGSCIMLFACFCTIKEVVLMLFFQKFPSQHLRPKAEVGLVGHSQRLGTGCHGYGFCG